MLKKIAVFSLLFIMLLQISGKLAVFAYYQINKKYISENLCENRNNPQLHCNGKCHLAKELAKEENRRQSPNNTLKLEKDLVLYSESYNFNLQLLNNEKVSPVAFYLLIPCSAPVNSTYHPPCC